MKLYNPFKLFRRRKNSIWKDESGRYKTIVYTGKKRYSGTPKTSTRNVNTLETYWKYYNGEGIVFASINITAWNTVMVGYHLTSEDEEAKKLIQKYLDKLNFQSILLDNVVFALVYGDAFIEIVRTPSGRITDLKTVDPKTIVINTDPYGNIESYQQIINGKVRDVVLKPEDIIHIKFFPNPSSPYGISLIEPSKNTIDRKIETDEAIFNAIQRHTAKYVITVGNENDIPPREIMEDIEKKFEDIVSTNEFVVPGVVKIDTIDEKGVQGVEEYFNIFLTQSVIGLLCPEEALGLGQGSTEATAKVKEILYERMIRAFQMKLANQTKNELIDAILKEYNKKEGTVDIKFNSVTDADEAVKAKWLGNLLRGYREGEEKPFSVDEIRAMFGYAPLKKDGS